MKLKRLLRRKESTFISHRYYKWERIYFKIYNYLYKKQNRLYNTYIDIRAYLTDTPQIIKLRAFMLDLILTWLVYIIIIVCIKYSFNRLDLLNDISLALGIAVLSPVVQYYINWYFKVKAKPFNQD